MGCLKLHTEKNYTALKVVYSAVNTSVLAELNEKNTSSFLEVVYRNAQGGGGIPNDGGGRGSIPGLPDIAPNMFPGVGIEVNTLATITGRGYYDNKTKTLQLPIGAKTSYAQHEYGHYLQSQQMPASCYDAVEDASFWNGVFHPDTHNSFWTEKDANRRSIEFFGPSSDIAKFGLWPQ